MANFRQVNAALKRIAKANGWPTDFELVHGDGYCYWTSQTDDRVLSWPSIYTHPTSTDTNDLIRLAVYELEDNQQEDNQRG